MQEAGPKVIFHFFRHIGRHRLLLRAFYVFPSKRKCRNPTCLLVKVSEAKFSSGVEEMLAARRVPHVPRLRRTNFFSM